MQDRAIYQGIDKRARLFKVSDERICKQCEVREKYRNPGAVEEPAGEAGGVPPVFIFLRGSCRAGWRQTSPHIRKSPGSKGLRAG